MEVGRREGGDGGGGGGEVFMEELEEDPVGGNVVFVAICLGFAAVGRVSDRTE